MLSCFECELNFVTGNFAGGDSFDGGGSFILTGSVFDGATLVASGVLIDGTFTEARVFTLGTQGFFAGAGVDSKNAALLAFFGLAPGSAFSFANSEIAVGQPITAGTAFNVDVSNADLDNEFVPVPEPGALVLLGLGFLGIGRRLTKRRS
ncbi:MAG: PEP-CTERM sorting domain-containing protein [Acidobacteria bacterium]|nr:PEP-CTERM sorting domain-containing protein [Acidobacteriota bacterium]